MADQRATAPTPANLPSDAESELPQRQEVQCKRCGSDMAHITCENCGGDGVSGHECGEDTCVCPHPEDNIPCDICEGRGGWYLCLAGEERCQANPLEGREKVQRSTEEWFNV